MNDRQYLNLALRHILLNPDEFEDGFDDWVYDNLHIQRRFDQEALAVAQSGRTHYSAYIIVQYIRHWTALYSTSGELKISNNWTPSIARLFAFMHPQHKDLFDFHELFSKRKRQAA